MAVIVRNTETDEFYVLVGTSYSYFKDTRESFLGGALFPHEEEGTFDLVAVTDETGRIEWITSDKMEIIEIDGVKPKDILSGYVSNKADTVDDTNETELCPGCGSTVEADERVCHSCGLTLIL